MKTKGVIFFDLDDTLFESTNFSEFVKKESLKEMIAKGLEADIDSLYDNYKKVYEYLGANARNHYNHLLEEFYNLSAPEIDRLVAAAVLKHYKLKSAMRLFDNCEKVLKKLVDSGYKIGIISAGNGKNQWDKIFTLNLNYYFDKEDVYITESNGFEKEAGFYKEIFDEYSKGCGTKNIIMVGDREDNEIEPAKEAGMKTIRLKQGKYAGKFPDSSAEHVVNDYFELEGKLDEVLDVS